jgi:hypothetical protein
LIQTYLATFADIGVETWIMHGSLLGWWWNRKVRLLLYFLSTLTVECRFFLGTLTSMYKWLKNRCNSLRATTT